MPSFPNRKKAIIYSMLTLGSLVLEYKVPLQGVEWKRLKFNKDNILRLCTTSYIILLSVGFTNLLKELHFMVAYGAVEVRQGALAIYSDSFSEIFDCKTKRFDVVLQCAPTKLEKKQQ